MSDCCCFLSNLAHSPSVPALSYAYAGAAGAAGLERRSRGHSLIKKIVFFIFQKKNRFEIQHVQYKKALGACANISEMRRQHFIFAKNGDKNSTAMG